jgi:hypothetical protein
VFSKRKLFLMYDDSSNHITRFQLSNVQVLWPWHHSLRIWALLSGLATAALPWMDFWSSRGTVFCGNRVFKMNIQFCCHLCCSSSVILRNNPSQCTTNSFCQCWFSPAVPYRSRCLPMTCECPHNLTETVALDLPNNVADFVTDAPAKCAPRICPLSKWDKFPIYRFFHTDRHSTQSQVNLHEHYRV